jgi:hypothetical protein
VKPAKGLSLSILCIFVDGVTHLADYVVAGAAFEKLAKRLIKSGFKLSWVDRAGAVLEPDTAAKPTRSGVRFKYTCPKCSMNAWGKADIKLVCGECMKRLVVDR